MRIKIWIKLIVTSRAYTGRNLNMIPAEQDLLPILTVINRNSIVSDALTMLENMEHRGACGCDPESGDGAGILIQLPHEFFMEECSDLEISLPEPGSYGVGMIFFPKEPALKKQAVKLLRPLLKNWALNYWGIVKLRLIHP
jgi:glutamate synthase (NADPH/NADH) large chain